MASESQQKSNAAGLVLGICGVVLGVAALLFAFIPCLGALAFWPGVVAVILSLLGLFLSVRAKALPIIALVVSLAGTGVAYWQGERVKQAAEELKKELEKKLQDTSPSKGKND
jgi:hypothetical protein